LCFGASSCSIEDAHLGDAREQEIFSDGPIPWQVGQRQLWEQSHITAIFPEYQDVGEAIAMASHSIGFNEMPQYEIHLVEDQDWIEQVQVYLSTPLPTRRRFLGLLHYCKGSHDGRYGV
jgi:ribosomal protein L11 methylase PrmA